MIAYLSGKPLVKDTFTAILVNGVGYGVIVTQTSKLFFTQNDHVDLFVYSHIRQENFDLYGFLTEVEKNLFLKLIDVNGVGPKTAMMIMDRGVESIVKAVQEADVSFFSTIPRVGKKSAQKIIIELKSKIGGNELELKEPTGKLKDLQEALLSLGFAESESMRVIQEIDIESITIEEAIKRSIQFLTRK